MRRFLDAVRAEKKLITIASLLFILSIVAGYLASGPASEWLKQSGVWDQFMEKAKTIEKNPSWWAAFGLIFANNMFASMTMIGTGLFFGIYPLMGLVFNGMLVGVILGTASEQSGIHPLTLFITQILPHGILELPAVILAVAYGIRLGILVFRSMIGWGSPRLRKENRRAWSDYLRRITPMIIGIMVMLAVAAVIESGLIVAYAK
ncbi:stage II sporulation protein M [Kroppenstedtia sanguinis]|uniref:Stage II sporulation protein M n=1 Tax=Kroppenstedtia sanguinis TaxID=1380684 RepID=A0ABW4CDS9_9BACL